MRLIRRPFLPLFLLTLFTVYQVSITMFTHVHFISGTMVVHSHPFSDKHHTHTKTVIAVIARLGSFYSSEPELCENSLPVKRPVLWILEPAGATHLTAFVYAGSINLRAPPVC